MKQIMILLVLASPLHSHAKDYFVTSGQSLYLDVSPSSRITVGNNTIISVKDLGSKIKVSGKKKGQSKLKIGSKNHTIYIVNALEKDLYYKLETLVKTFKGLKLKMLNKKIAVEGKLLRVSDYKQIKILVAQSKLQISWHALVHEDIKKKFRQYINNELLKLGVEAHSIEDDYSVYLHKDYQKIKIEKILPGIQFYYLNQTPPFNKKIKVQLYFLEMSRSAQQKFGINWEQSLKKQLAPSTSTTGSLTAFISALEDTGNGKLLAKPHITTNSGTKGQFLAGGEFPIRSYNKENSGSISWKTYGIQLNITPTYYKNKIHLNINSETSNIDPSTSIDGLPGLKTNKVTSSVSMDNKEINVLSGVYKLEHMEGTKQIPLLADLPIIGELFKSHTFMKRESDLVILVQAEVL